MSRRARPARSGTYVTKGDCDKIMNPICVDVAVLKKALVGSDLRGGLVADMALLKGDVGDIKAFINGQRNEEKKKGRDWRLLGFAIGGSVVSGLIVAGASFLVGLLR